MAEPFMGQIIQGGWNFAPRGYAFCNGQLMSIQQNSALFTLLGNTFGGDGQQTFGLPNLQGRTMVAAGTLPGGSVYSLGEAAGVENMNILVSNLPSHVHGASFSSSGSTLNVSDTKATLQVAPANGTLGKSFDSVGTATPLIYCPAGTSASIPLGGVNAAGSVTVAPTGSNVPLSILQPFLAITMVIALQGIFPSRN